MKRRKFIKSSLVTTVALPALAGSASAGTDRLYGAPASLIPGGGSRDKFLLPLSRAGLPHGTWGEFSSVLEVVENILTSKEESGIFFKNPISYFEKHGLDVSDKTLVDNSMILLTCLANPHVQKSMRESDYATTCQYLEAAGLFEKRDPSILAERIQSVIEENRSELLKLMGSNSARLSQEQEAMLLDVLKESDTAVTEDDLAIITQLAASGVVTPLTCTVAVACVIVAALAAYVSVAVAVTVALMAGVTVSAAVYLAIAAKSTPPPELEAFPSIAGVTPDAPFTGAMAKFDPALMRNAERAVRVSKAMNDSGLQVHMHKQLIKEEVTAFMKAMQKTGLLPIDDTHLQLASQATIAYTYRVIGI